MIIKIDLAKLLLIILLQGFYSTLLYGEMSNSCTGFYHPSGHTSNSKDDPKILYWIYYFSENIPEQVYGQNSQISLPLQFEFKGDLTPTSTRVSYRKSIFFANSDSEPLYVIDRLSRDSETFQETLKILESVYQIYESRKIVSPNAIAEMRNIDKELSPKNLNYIVFLDPIKNEPKVVVRIFDGSPTNDFHKTEVLHPEKIPIEIEYPHLILPDRQLGNNFLIEIGRLGKEHTIKGDLQTLLRTVAEYLHQAYWSFWIDQRIEKKIRFFQQEPVIYIEALASAAKIYEHDYHFEKVFGPKDLRIPLGQPDRYILKIHASDFIRQHKDSFSLFKTP